MHADNPRQHSLALYDQPHPVGVVHVMVEVDTWTKSAWFWTAPNAPATP